MRTVASPCACCAVMIVPTKAYRRSAYLRERFRPHAARGLCQRCYWYARARANLIDFERRSVPAADVLDDWVILRDDGFNYRDAAARLGMTPSALDRALCRAKAAGDPRGSRQPFGRAA